MKTGDASAEFWLEGLRYNYVCEVVSSRKGGKGRVRYFWNVEVSEAFHDFRVVHETKFRACTSFLKGLELSRKYAEAYERKVIKKGI